MIQKIPFSYIWCYKQAIGNDIKTILDLGCDDGRFMKTLSEGESWNITGVEIFNESAQAAKKTGVYKTIITGDIEDVARKLANERKQYDVVFCSHVLEHLSKAKGKRILHLVDKICVKRSVMATPYGFMEQIEESLGENPHQEHISGWIEKDFRSFKYKVYGVGLRLFWSYFGLARSKNILLSNIFRIISFIFSPLVYFIPQLGVGIIAVKSYEK